MFAIRQNVCALSNHPWQHGSGKLWSRNCTGSFVGSFVFMDLQWSITVWHLARHFRKKRKHQPSCQLSQTRQCCAAKIFSFILDCFWKLFSTPPKIPTKRSLAAFSHDSVSTATLRLPTYLHLNLWQQIWTLSQQISRGLTTFHPRCHLPSFGNLQSNSDHNEKYVTQRQLFEPPLLLWAFWHGILSFQLKSPKRKTWNLVSRLVLAEEQELPEVLDLGLPIFQYLLMIHGFFVFGKTKVTTWGQTLLEFLTNLKFGKIFNQKTNSLAIEGKLTRRVCPIPSTFWVHSTSYSSGNSESDSKKR